MNPSDPPEVRLADPIVRGASVVTSYSHTFCGIGSSVLPVATATTRPAVPRMLPSSFCPTMSSGRPVMFSPSPRGTGLTGSVMS